MTQTGYYQDISQWCSGVTEHKPLGSRTQTDLKQTENSEKFFQTEVQSDVEDPDSNTSGKKRDKHEVEEEELLVLKWLVDNDKVV